MTIVELTARSLAELSLEEICGILNEAMDTGDWHTPSISDIKIHTQTEHSVYGYGNCSLHSNYHDKELWFNINSHSIKIWREEYVRGRANIHHYRPIYNIPNLAAILALIAYKKPDA